MAVFNVEFTDLDMVNGARVHCAYIGRSSGPGEGGDILCVCTMIRCSSATVGRPITKANTSCDIGWLIGAVRCLEFANMVGKEVTLFNLVSP